MGAQWSPSGYDMSIATRWLYVFGTDGGDSVKVGLVLTEEALSARVRRVAKDCGRQDLRILATAELVDVDHPTAEHVEAAVRLRIVRDPRFALDGRVDWITVRPGPTPDWQCLLDEAVQAVRELRSTSV